MPTESMVAHVLVNKYADHLPLYRQTQIFRRTGRLALDRSTLSDRGRRAAFKLRPLFRALVAHLLRSSKLFMDETSVLVLVYGRKKTKSGKKRKRKRKRGWFQVVWRDDAPWNGPAPPGVVFFYADGRGGTTSNG